MRATDENAVALHADPGKRVAVLAGRNL